MPYVNVPNDLSKIKTKIAFNLTKRQLICFGIGAAIGVPTYLLTRGAIGNTGALFVMLGIMLPAFLMAMYEKDGLPFEKVLRNMINTKFLRPGIRPYRTQNIYAPFTGKEESKGINWGLWALVFSANMTINWVKYIKLHRQYAFLIAIAYTILVSIMSGYYIYNLILSSTLL